MSPLLVSLETVKHADSGGGVGVGVGDAVGAVELVGDGVGDFEGLGLGDAAVLAPSTSLFFCCDAGV